MRPGFGRTRGLLGFRNRAIAAHNEAIADGLRHRSPAYYARMDGKGAELGGAIAGPVPLLSGDMLDTAKSWYGSLPGGKSYGATDEEVSRAWHEAGNSPNAHRKREEWALRD